MSTTKQEKVNMAKRRLTGAIRQDIHNHLRRNSGLPVKEEEALKALRTYIAVCWYEWATGKTDRIERLPGTCYVDADYFDYLCCSNFYAGSDSIKVGRFLGARDVARVIIKGLGTNNYKPRNMSLEQMKEVKRLGKDWDDAKAATKTFVSDLGSVLSSNTTVEGLIDDLPQCAEFAKQFLNPKRDQQTSLVVPGAHKRIRKALRDGAKA